MKKILGGLVSVAGVVSAAVALVLYGVVAWGFVFSKTWLWLAVPAFGLTSITWQQGAVAVLLFRFIRGSGSSDSSGEDISKQWGEIFKACLMPWVSLGVASLASAFLF